MASYLRHKVLPTDTLRGLSLYYLGDHDRWAEIVALNNLDPGQYDLYSQGVRELLIPIEVGPGGNNLDNPYLVDLAVEGGVIQLAPSGGVMLRVGVANVLASLVRALSTPRGSLLPHPAYGLDMDRFVGMAGTRLFLPLLRVEAERVIRRDPRVNNVNNVQVVQLPGLRQIQIGAAVQLIGSRDAFDLVVERTF